MKRSGIILCLWLGGVTMAAAQSEPMISSGEESLLERLTGGQRKVDWADMNIQFCSAVDASFQNGKLDEAAFKVHRIRLEVLGGFHEKFTYHFRQSLNQYTTPNIPLDNLSGSVELAMVGWQLNDKWKLTAGKQPVQFSGYECWVNAIKVRHYSDFNNTIPCYQAGVNVAYKMNDSHEFNFQLTNNRNGDSNDQFMYGLPEDVEATKIPLLATVNWDGYFVDHAMQLRYSLSYGQLAKNKNVFYFTCGNVWDKKPFLGYVDFMYSREGIDSKGLISGVTVQDGVGQTLSDVDYFTTIFNLDYRVASHWNLYVKGVYEQGNVFKSSGNISAGTYRRVWNAQLCAEYYPLKNSELLCYLHLLYKNVHLTERATRWGAESYNQQRISLGLVYTLPVF
ncbi:MAG TPA: OprO/OprP family phosphate-selective porin [Bacteroides mediterraneensis]|uniref:OprO/OprP family phosphate-selective porin n=1 Tax=Bacteroides mediterraneensis TaxID=1841856 RepID=UPI0026EC8F89|nr:OprO/OprP family phosphate-selective porin [Bacteroides mediterraneensis]HJH65185.1 OprO/OprP family phosphate-selective porin [Bacteroides mediterraneensis]